MLLPRDARYFASVLRRAETGGSVPQDTIYGDKPYIVTEHSYEWINADVDGDYFLNWIRSFITGSPPSLEEIEMLLRIKEVELTPIQNREFLKLLLVGKARATRLTISRFQALFDHFCPQDMREELLREVDDTMLKEDHAMVTDKKNEAMVGGHKIANLDNTVQLDSEKGLVMKAESKTGGIDLTSDKALTVQNNGRGIKFHLDPAMLQQLQNAPGFVPVIINIQPLNNLKLFLGIDSNISL
jgi:hypothetical protein